MSGVWIIVGWVVLLATLGLLMATVNIDLPSTVVFGS